MLPQLEVDVFQFVLGDDPQQVTDPGDFLRVVCLLVLDLLAGAHLVLEALLDPLLAGEPDVDRDVGVELEADAVRFFATLDTTVRRLVPPLRVREAVEGATVETGEKLFGPVTLFGITSDQVRGLEAPLTLV